MTTQVQLRRGSDAAHTAFIGAPAEVTVVTDDWSVRVHDGITPGGHPIGGGGGGDPRIAAVAMGTFTFALPGGASTFVGAVLGSLGGQPNPYVTVNPANSVFTIVEPGCYRVSLTLDMTFSGNEGVPNEENTYIRATLVPTPIGPNPAAIVGISPLFREKPLPNSGNNDVYVPSPGDTSRASMDFDFVISSPGTNNGLLLALDASVYLALAETITAAFTLTFDRISEPVQPYIPLPPPEEFPVG